MTPTNFNKNTALASPLYFYQGDTDDQLNGNWAVNYLIEKGVPSDKIVLFVAFGGFSYRLSSAQENGLYARGSRDSLKPFFEFCDNIKQAHWSVIHDTNRIGSYAYLGEQWISYDDVEDVNRKAQYILKMNLGGGAILNLNSDDLTEKCGCGKTPLLTAMNHVLRNLDGPKPNNCT